MLTVVQLKSFYSEIEEYRLPFVLDFEQAELIVFHDVPKKRSSVKKRKNAISDGNGSNEGENETKHTDDEEYEPNEVEEKENVGLGNRFYIHADKNLFSISYHPFRK